MDFWGFIASRGLASLLFNALSFPFKSSSSCPFVEVHPAPCACHCEPPVCPHLEPTAIDVTPVVVSGLLLATIAFGAGLTAGRAFEPQGVQRGRKSTTEASGNIDNIDDAKVSPQATVADIAVREFELLSARRAERRAAFALQ